MRNFLILVASAFLLSACARTIPETARMNESIMANIRTSQARVISYEFISEVKDGIIKPCGRDSRKVNDDHSGYIHSESSMLNKMLTEYMTMKFSSIEAGPYPRIKVTLKDFWIEQYSTDSLGKALFVAMAGGEINIVVVANLQLMFEVTKDGSTTRKTVRVSGDNVHVAGMGTGTETSRYHQGKQGIEFDIAGAMNAANNKAVIMLNQFIDVNAL